jgi:hypothetical protein
MKLSEGRSLQITLPADLYAAVDGYVERTGSGVSDVVRRLVSMGVEAVSKVIDGGIRPLDTGRAKGSQTVRIRFDAQAIAQLEAYAADVEAAHGHHPSLSAVAVYFARVAVESGVEMGPRERRGGPSDRREPAGRDYPGRRLGDLMRALRVRRQVEVAEAAAAAGIAPGTWSAVESGKAVVDDVTFTAVVSWIEGVTPAARALASARAAVDALNQADGVRRWRLVCDD